MAGENGQPKPPVIEGATCTTGRPETKTDFIQYPLKELKQMLDGTNPGAIEEVGRHWGKVKEILAGGKDGEGIAGLLDKAVNDVLEHWGGEAATSFAKKARTISQSVRNAAWHADLNSGQMTDAATQLRTYKAQLDDIKEPSGWAKVGDALSDWQWDDGSSTANDLKDRKLTTAEVAQINEGKIGASREAQLNGVAVMENLGAQYMRVTRNLKNNPIQDDGEGNIKEPNRNVEIPPPVVPGGTGGASRPGAVGSGPKPWSAGPPKGVDQAPAVPRPKGITGGSQLPPSTGTNVDGIKPGLTGPGPGTGGPGPIGGGGGTGPGGGAGPGVMVPSGGGGLGKGGGRGGLGIPGAGGGRAGGLGGSGAGRNGAGRAGMGGMGGGAGAGAAGRGGAGAGGRGALAKARGGVVGAAKGIAGKGAGSGSGLHGSRGGSQRGGMMGGAGGMGGRGGNRRGEEENGGERPDWLVEDEETWISEEDRNRNVPRNIE
ncbi:hypothetical protein [Streptomyces sp. NBC_01304]|uniref:hypothetical protein n=1 Tax=Streptomyces sp. NBC_01304 TaxID=2903818 RepID=UPI002E135E1C|nr:hypothetical protein OG430_15365 [Streptomyces sp. NBC_01304]